MEQFHCGHLPSRFGDLNPISDQKKSPVHPEDGGVNLEEKSNPRSGENLRIQSATVEKVENSIITAFLQAHGADDARCAP